MSAEAEQPNSLPDPPSIGDLIASDFYLEMLVRNAEKGAAFGITLYLGGTVISGTLIPASAFYREFGEQVASALQGRYPEDAGVWREVSEKFAEGNEAEREKTPYRSYIHLRNAKLLDGNGSTIHIPLWRGRLALVSAFSLGEFAQ